MIKVHRGTRSDAVNLCDSCSQCHRMYGPSDSQEIRQCNVLSAPFDRLHWPVVECSSYNDKSRPSLYNMSQIAWFFDPSVSTKKSQFGFMKKSDLEKIKPGEEILPGVRPWD